MIVHHRCRPSSLTITEKTKMNTDFQDIFGQHLCELTASIYPHFQLNLEAIKLPTTPTSGKKFLVQNRLNYLSAIKFPKATCTILGEAILEEWTSQTRIYNQNLASALKLISNEVPLNDWVLLKTLSCYPHFTSDIDILLRDATKIDLVMKQNDHLTNCMISRGINEAAKIKVLIDAQSRVSWTNTADVTNAFVFNNLVKTSFKGINYMAPNPSADFLVRLGHMPFEQAEIRLGELLHMYQLFTAFPLANIANEASQCNWTKTFVRTMKTLNNLHIDLFGSALTTKRASFVHGKYAFPLRLSYLDLTKATFEKRAWKKFWGARYVVLDRVFQR